MLEKSFMDGLTLGLAAASLFVAGVIKGATGIGYVSCALPFLVMITGLQQAMVIVLAPAMATNVVVALTAGHLREALKFMWPFYAAILPGVAAGLTLMLLVEQRVAVAGLGAIMILYSVFSLAKPAVIIPARWQSPLKVPAGFLNGVVTGLTGSQVMPLLPYVLGLHLAPSLSVQVVNLAVIVSTVVVGIGLAAGGLLSATLLWLSCVAVVPAVAGTALGSYLRALLPVESFRAVTLAVLAAMGASMIVRW